MKGHSVFTYSAPVTMAKTKSQLGITTQQYADWQQQFTVDALLGQRYGQSFCNRFGITDNLLFHTTDIEWCENYIRKNYLARS
jgi:hypothetical protein